MATDNAITAMRLQQESCDNRNIPQLRNSHNGGMDIETIRKGLEKEGKSQRGLAVAMGIDPTAVSRLLNGQRQLKANEVPKVEAYLNASPESTHKSKQNNTSLDRGVALASTGGGTAEGARLPQLPVLGMAECGPDGWSLFNGDLVELVTMPANLVGVKGAYGVYIQGESMSPRYRPGEIAHIHPHKPLTVGAYVLVQKKPKAPGEAPQAVIKELIRRSGSKITLAQYNPPKTFEIRVDEVVSIHRVVGSAEG